MSTPKARAFALGLLMSGAACDAREHRLERAAPVASVSHDARVLGRVLSLPATPVEVAFEQIPLGTPGGLGPTDYLFVAVLRFDATVLGRLVAGAPDAGSESGLSALANRPWFPEAVKAKLVPAAHGGFFVPGRELDTRAWLRSSYSLGDIVAVEGTDYVIVVAGTT